MIIVYDEIDRNNWQGSVQNIYGVFDSTEAAKKALEESYPNQIVTHIRMTKMFALSLTTGQLWPSSLYYYREIELNKPLF